MTDDLRLQDFLPESQLVLPEHHIERARFPAIDAHNHMRWLHSGSDQPQDSHPEALIAALDRHNVRGIVDLDGFVNGRLRAALDDVKAKYPDRVAVLAALDWSVTSEPGWPDALVRQFQEAIKLGVDGLKIFKSLGLTIRDETGRLIAVDDPRLDDLWQTAAEANLPVLIHVADPVAFFRPLDGRNERWDELHLRPEWSFYGPQFPSFEALMEQLLGLVGRHPRTVFQVAHVGGYAENLGWVADQLLRPHPNVFVDISERIAELGRQPHRARWFLQEFQDRVLFGTDRPPLGPWYPYYFRFLETLDDYFPHGPEVPPRQGRWNIHGVGLPDSVLDKLYRRNALRLYPGLKAD
ncbi:MAG: amidohydrolase family protein [Anaerolineae bacterium]|jgi:predicted TIM-barrel fold metal-dependent hydrolase